MCPQNVFNNWNFDRSEILIAEPPFLHLSPSQPKLVDFEHMLKKLEFLWPEEVVRIEVELIEAFLGESFARREVGWVGWKC